MTIKLKYSFKQLCIILTLLSLFGSSEPASSVSVNEEESNDLDTPESLAWKSWILQNSQPGSKLDQDLSTVDKKLLRKSVFIAPSFDDDKSTATSKPIVLDPKGMEDFYVELLRRTYGRNESRTSN